MFCLPFSESTKFKEKLISGEIDPSKLSEMSSAERRSLFEKFTSETNAREVNAQFEAKLLLKNQQQAMINWAKQVAGLKPQALRDIIARVNKLTEVLQPKDQQAFLEDLAAHRLGVAVTMEEAGHISDLAKEVTTRKDKITPEMPDGSETRLEYGRSRVAFGEFLSDLKNDAKKINFSDGVMKYAFDKTKNLPGFAKAMKSTLDNSVIGRQGLKVLFTHPSIWLSNSRQSFVDIVRTFGGKEVMREVMADVLSRKNSVNGLYAKEKLAIGNTEEAFPTSMPEKIPLIGKVFKASETAFTAFQYRTRADIFDKYVELAEKSDASIKGIGKLSNSLTGRGTFGQVGEAGLNAVNNVFFSPRMLKSNFDALTGHLADYKSMDAFARKQAAINTVKIITAMAGIMAITHAINPNSVELDPRSSDFGKIKIRDTRFDITGGMASLATLAARSVTLSSKSTTTKKINKLNSGKYGAQTLRDVFVDFASNKASPAAAVILDTWLRGTDFSGKKPTLKGELENFLVPLPITNYQELKNDPNSANKLLAILADALGISTNTYKAQKKKAP